MKEIGISIIGAGKVATALAMAIYRNGYPIHKIVSPSADSAKTLAGLCGAKPGSDYNIPADTDILILAVPDHELTGVAEMVKTGSKTLVVHTAGSFGLEVYPAGREYKCGVLYPLQTFSKGREPEMEEVPLFLEVENDSDLDLLQRFAKSLSGKVFTVDLETRQRLHLAAVFACNFVNHMLSVAEKITYDSGIDIDVFEPLVRETFEKAFILGPANAQTGPAVRNDINTIEKHLDLLSFSPELKEVYKAVSESIIKTHIH